MIAFESRRWSNYLSDKFFSIDESGRILDCNIDDSEIEQLTNGKIKSKDDMITYTGSGIMFFGKTKTLFIWGISWERAYIRRTFIIYSNSKAESFKELISNIIRKLEELKCKYRTNNYIHVGLKTLKEMLDHSSSKTDICEKDFSYIRFVSNIKISNPEGDLSRILNKGDLSRILNILNLAFSKELDVEISYSRSEKGEISLNYDIDNLIEYVESEIKKGNIVDKIPDDCLRKVILIKKLEGSLIRKICKDEWKVWIIKNIPRKYYLRTFILFILLIIIPPIFISFDDRTPLVIRTLAFLLGLALMIRTGSDEFFNNLRKQIDEEVRKYNKESIAEDISKHFNLFKYVLKDSVEEKCKEIKREIKKEITGKELDEKLDEKLHKTSKRCLKDSEKELKNVKDLRSLVELVVKEQFGSPEVIQR